MTAEPDLQSIARNVRLYPWYALTFNAYFWMPVFFLYFLQHMSLAEVLQLEAIYYLAVVVLEVPSGYFSDRVGRRPTLLIANASLIAGYVAFFIGGSFAVFALAQVLLATGLAFNSGTDTSLHYDSLATLNRASEFDAREAVVARNGLLASGVAGLAGGAIGLIDLRYAYGLSALASAVSLTLVALMHEPTSHERPLVPTGLGTQLRTCRDLLHERFLGWTFAYVVVMTVLNHVPYEFYQPYIEHAFREITSLRATTPLASGVHVGIVMLIASAFAARSIACRDRIGYVRTLLLATTLQVVIILVMGLVLHPVLLLVILLRSVPRALAAAPVNAAIAPRVGRGQRATFLSLQSLAGRLAFAAFLLGLSVVPTPLLEGDAWTPIAWKLIVSATAGILALAFLVATAPRRARRQ